MILHPNPWEVDAEWLWVQGQLGHTVASGLCDPLNENLLVTVWLEGCLTEGLSRLDWVVCGG